MFCHGLVTLNKMELIRPILEIKLVFILPNILVAPENRDNVPTLCKQLSKIQIGSLFAISNSFYLEFLEKRIRFS